MSGSPLELEPSAACFTQIDIVYHQSYCRCGGRRKMAASTVSLPSVIPGSLRRRPSKRRLTTSSTRPQPRVNMAVSTSSSSYAAPGAGSSTAATSFKVALLGAAGDVGRPLSLLLKMSPYITSLSLHDPDSSAAFGVAGSLAECNTPCRVSSSPDPIATLRGADLVVMVPPADVDVEDDCDDGSADGWCDAVASAVGLWAAAVADSCPEALVHVVSPAADSVVPMAAEVMRRRGDYDPRRLFGVTTLDAVRASTFAAEMRRDLRLIDVAVPVVGGHGGRTALPLLSKARPATAIMWSDRDAAEVTRRVRGAEREVAAARGGGFGCRHHGSALAAAYAAARFVDSSVRASLGEEDHAGWGVCECALVESSVVAGVPYFASRVWLGRDGVEGFVTGDLEGVSPFEAEALEELKPALLHSIERGLDAAARI